MRQTKPDSTGESALQRITRFSATLNAHDVEAMMRLMTGDCTLENTDPPPDGTRYAGQAAVRAFWEQFFRTGHDKGSKSRKSSRPGTAS